MKKFFKATLLICFCLLPSLQVFAGDLMNIEFLQSRAQRLNPEIKKLSLRLNEQLYGKSKAALLSALPEAASEGLFGASFAFDNFRTNEYIGLTATGLGLLSLAVDKIVEHRDAKRTRELLSLVEKQKVSLDERLKALYYQVKEGSTDARNDLISLTDAASVEEVENNLKMEKFFKEQMSKQNSEESILSGASNELFDTQILVNDQLKSDAKTNH